MLTIDYKKKTESVKNRRVVLLVGMISQGFPVPEMSHDCDTSQLNNSYEGSHVVP